MKRSNHYNISTQGFDYTKKREYEMIPPTPSTLIDPATPQRPAQPIMSYHLNHLNKMNVKGNKKISKFQRD